MSLYIYIFSNIYLLIGTCWVLGLTIGLPLIWYFANESWQLDVSGMLKDQLLGFLCTGVAMTIGVLVVVLEK